MRTTVTLDDDVAALIESERRRTGETFRQALNRLLRRAAQGGQAADDIPPLPLLPGRARVDVNDVSALISGLDDDRNQDRGSF